MSLDFNSDTEPGTETRVEGRMLIYKIDTYNTIWVYVRDHPFCTEAKIISVMHSKIDRKIIRNNLDALVKYGFVSVQFSKDVDGDIEYFSHYLPEVRL